MGHTVGVYKFGPIPCVCLIGTPLALQLRPSAAWEWGGSWHVCFHSQGSQWGASPALPYPPTHPPTHPPLSQTSAPGPLWTWTFGCFLSSPSKKKKVKKKSAHASFLGWLSVCLAGAKLGNFDRKQEFAGYLCGWKGSWVEGEALCVLSSDLRARWRQKEPTGGRASA